MVVKCIFPSKRYLIFGFITSKIMLNLVLAVHKTILLFSTSFDAPYLPPALQPENNNVILLLLPSRFNIGKRLLLQHFKCQIKSPANKCKAFYMMSGKRDSNPRPRPWQGRALPTELFSQWYPEGDLNPHDHNDHWILSPTCLPIPPSGHPLFIIERETGLEPATPTLARSCSTN